MRSPMRWLALAAMGLCLILVQALQYQSADLDEMRRQSQTHYQAISGVEAELESLKPQLQLAQSEFARSKSLFDKRIIARKQYDEAVAREQQLSGEHRTAVAEVQAARNKLAEAQAERAQLDVLDSEVAKLKFEENELRAQLARQKLDLQDRNISVPVSGVIDKTFVDIGEYVTPGQRLVFLDEGVTSTESWTVYRDREQWWDNPTARHGLGTNWGMADGHVEHWMWKDMRTVKIAEQEGDWQALKSATGNPDLIRVQKGAWGKLKYVPSL